MLLLPDFSLTQLQTLLDLVYRRDTRHTCLHTAQLQECLKLTNINQVDVNGSISLSDPQTSVLICKASEYLHIITSKI